MKKLEIFQVDAFTKHPFKGNPAAVCILDKEIDEQLMQNIAGEMNLSETAFVWRKDDMSYNLKWFTPEVEVELCGHATLSAAHILAELGLESGRIQFETLSGSLFAESISPGEIKIDLPVSKTIESKSGIDFTEILGYAPVSVFESKNCYIVELSSEEDVKNVSPDFEKLKQLEKFGTIITSTSQPKYDFISRFFAPQKGINEDPVTGSAHCVLADYWNKKLKKTRFTAYQASKRGGELLLNLNGDRVEITGNAVTVMKAEIYF